MKRAISLIVLSCAIAAYAQSAAAATFFAPVYSDDQVRAFDVGVGGTLTETTGSPFGVPDGGTTGFATTPDQKKGLSAYLFNPGVRGASIGENGSVTPAQPKIGLGSNGVYNVAVSPDSRFAYVATRYYPGSGPAGVRAYSFAENGALTELAGSPFANAWEFFDVAVTPDQKFLYGTVGMGVIAMSVNTDGTLTFIGQTAPVVAEWVMTSPDGRFVFVGGEESGNAAVFSFSINPDGTLTQVGSPVVATDVSGQVPAAAPNGRFIYLPELNDDIIYAARVNPDGSLSLAGSLPVQDPRSLVVSPDSKYLFMYTSGSGENLLRSTIGADGVPQPPQTLSSYDPGEPIRMHFRTGYGAVANFTATPEAKPLTVKFDGSKSTAKQGALGDLDWTFGSEPVVTGAVQTRTFPKPGVYDVSLTARDAGGCGSERAWIGQTAPCMGSPESTKTIKFDTPPWVTSLSISPKRIGKRSKAKFKLTEKARVTFTVQKPAAGRLVGSSCRKQTSKNRKAKRCTRWLNVKSFRVNGKARSNSVKFTGTIGKTKLKKGKYRLRAIAVDSAKGKSPQRTVGFRIR